MKMIFTHKGADDPNIRIYTDSDYAQDTRNRKLRAGFLATFNGHPFHYRSTMETCMAQSTFEAELIAAVQAIKEALWLREIMSSMSCRPPVCIPVHIDNQAVLAFSANAAINQRSKHIEVRYHAIRHYVETRKFD